MTGGQTSSKVFRLILIKPSHYDDEGYVIQWLRSSIPANSLATVYGLALDCAERKVLGEDVEIRLAALDETNTRIKVDDIAAQIKAGGGSGLVGLVGVQSNQFPRAMDLARKFRAAGVPVAMGGFHVSGCLAMLNEMPADLQEAVDEGISLFAGELESGRLDSLLRDAYAGRLQPVYNYMSDLPGIGGEAPPFLPIGVIEKTAGKRASFDAGRGCPYLCSFCTIINVQGRRSRYRSADDVERIIRKQLAQGVHNFFITDDNFARNRDWETLLDRIIHLREVEKLNITIIIQVDTMCHKIPRFIEKAGRAGVTRVFIGMENINPDALQEARKGQNRITEYRAMLQAWHSVGALTYAGYILGFPGDTPETIERDIKIIQRELPVDLLEFFILTPLPGSRDHKELLETGQYMDPDMNKYDLEHVTTRHPTMSPEELKRVYLKAWDIYYSPGHVATVIRRAKAWGFDPRHMMIKLLSFYACIKLEKMHPLEGGLFRRKYRRDRRPGFPTENPLVFYSRYLWELLDKYTRFAVMTFQYKAILRRVMKETDDALAGDVAMMPVAEDELEKLELYNVTEAAKVSVKKIKRHKSAAPAL
ncbi:MAG TPA: radical SAM protein [Gammaproteobacteria bacterium]|nr:radical SAM protein [Gammaproteobacteria bacterium]